MQVYLTPALAILGIAHRRRPSPYPRACGTSRPYREREDRRALSAFGGHKSHGGLGGLWCAGADLNPTELLARPTVDGQMRLKNGRNEIQPF